MHRFASRFAGVAVCAVALAGCASSDGAKTTTAIAPVSRMSPDNTLAANVNDALAQAQALRTGGDFEGATKIMAQLMLAQPDDARIVGEYGKLLAQENRSTDAVNFLRRAVELSPSDWTYYSALGVSYDQLGDHDNARLAYERALSLKPGTAVVLNNYAMSRMLAGDANGAHVLMAKAQATGSLDPRIAQNIASLDAAHPAPAPVAVAAIAPVKPVAAPVPLVAAAPHANANRIVMQDVPVDTHAGPVDAKKPARKHLASAPHTPAKVADAVTHATPVKTADAAKPVKAADTAMPVKTAEVVKPAADAVTHATPVKVADIAKPVKPADAAKPVKTADVAKPVKTADVAKPAKIADTAKPVKKAKSDGIPQLRQTADASKP